MNTQMIGSRTGLRVSIGGMACLVACLCCGPAVQAQINTGSDGHDGAFNPTTNTVVNMANHPDGIYQYTSVNIPSVVTVNFIPNANNSPVVWLVQSNCLINGVVDVSGKPGSFGLGGLGGPGGYPGGSSGGSVLTAGGGPGGGPIGTPEGGNASYGTLGETNGNAPPGAIYGNSFILPLLGGSGGGAGSGGGGGGGGAILIGAPKIVLNGTLLSRGESYGSGGGGYGSGGAIRLVATSITGSGSVDATCINNNGGNGRIRFDALQVNFAYISGAFTQGFQPIIIPGLGQGVQLSIASAAGFSTPTSPKGEIMSPDIVISAQTANPVPVVLQCANIPLNTTITVFAVPAIGPQVQASGVNSSGTLASSTATISLNLPHGAGIIYAQAVTGLGAAAGASFNRGAKAASYAQTGLTTSGERFVKMEVTAPLGGPQQVSYITKSGKKYPLPTK